MNGRGGKGGQGRKIHQKTMELAVCCQLVEALLLRAFLSEFRNLRCIVSIVKLRQSKIFVLSEEPATHGIRPKMTL